MELEVRTFPSIFAGPAYDRIVKREQERYAALSPEAKELEDRLREVEERAFIEGTGGERREGAA